MAKPLREILADAEGRAEPTYTDDFVAAIHEAGHACIAPIQGFRVEAVDLIQAGDHLGIARIDGEGRDWEERFRYILAGTIAEEMAGGDDPETLAMHRGG